MQKMRVAIIGLGNITHAYEDIPSIKKQMQYPTHLSVLKKDKRFQLVAAADKSPEQRRSFQKKVSTNIAIYADYAVMIKKEQIDLLVVAVPTQAHYAVCSAALGLGIKNILCEKPITRTLDEAAKLYALSKRYRARILVNYQRSYSQGYTRLMGSVRKKNRGRVLSVTVQYNNGIFNTATHLIHLLEKMFGPIQKVRSIKKSVRGLIDPNISFTAFTRGFNIFFEGVDGAAYRLVEIDIKFAKERLVLNGDSFAGKSILDVYANTYQVIKYNKKPGADMASSIQALKVAARAVESARIGKLINI